MLEKLKDTVLLVKTKLSSPISLDIYSSWSAALTGGKKLNNITAHCGMRHPIYVGQLSDEK